MKKAFAFTLATLASFIMVWAQDATIQGVVRDATTDELLFGVNVVEKGTTHGVSTGLDGDFTIQLSAGSKILVFSYLGYESREMRVNVTSGESRTLNVTLQEEVSLLETVVISASKFEKKLGEETVSLDVIKPAAVENQNLVTIDNAVERNPGVAVIDRQINIRGGAGYSYGAGSRVSVLLDDLPILQADAGMPNWSAIPTENIGQIEIIKGAASALYGSSAMNGIVNVRTAYPTSEPVTKISVWGTQYANPNSKNGRADWWNMTPDEIHEASGSEVLIKQDENTLENKFKNKKRMTRPYSAGLSFGHRQKFGKFDLVMGGQVSSEQSWKYGDYEHRGRLSVQTRYRFSEKVNIGLNASTQAGKNGTFFLWNGYEGVNRYIPGDIIGDPTNTKQLRVTIDPFFNYQDEKGNKHKLQGRWYKVDNENNNDQGNFSNSLYGEYQYQKRWEDINLTLTTGGVASYVNVRAPLYAEEDGNDKFNGRNFAAFLQLDKKFFSKLNVSVGARVENFKISSTEAETKPVFRAGLNYEAAEHTFIRTSVGQGYRFPTIAEKFVNTTLGSEAAILPNKGLTSETGVSAELGIKQGIKLGGFSAYLDVAGFFNKYKNMMEFNPTDDIPVGYMLAFQSQNVGNTRIWGLETSIMGEGKIANKFPTTAMLGYTFINPKYLDWEEAKSESITDYNVLKYRFRHTFTGAWDINFMAGSGSIDFGVSGRYFSFMENVDYLFTLFINGLTEYRDSRLKSNHRDLKNQRKHKGDFILDLRAGYTFHRNNNKFKIAAIMKNVANKEYTLRPGMIEAPMSYTLRLDIEF